MVDALDTARLTRRLATAGWNRDTVEVVAETGSTNADLIEAARAGAPEWTVRVAAHQTAGRGRFSRTWTAPPGAAWAISVLLRPTRSVDRWPWLSLLTGVALAEAFDAVGVAARVKWPNDVLAPGGKLCGILAERTETPDGPAVVVGFGINLSMTADQLPVPTASSLRLEGADPDPAVLVGDVLARWRELATDWAQADDAALRERYLNISDTVGRQVKVLTDESGEVGVRGRACGIDESGRLLVDTDTGTQAFAAGDVIHLR